MRPLAARAAEPITKAAKITLDDAGVLVVDGKKVFPITLTIVPGPDAKAPSGRPAYAEFADSRRHLHALRQGRLERGDDREAKKPSRPRRRRTACAATRGWAGICPTSIPATRRRKRELQARDQDVQGLARHGPVEGRRRAGLGQLAQPEEGDARAGRPRREDHPRGRSGPPDLARAGPARHGRSRSSATTTAGTSAGSTSTRSATRRASTPSAEQGAEHGRRLHADDARGRAAASRSG